MSEILVVGSIGYDTIATNHGKVESIMGGSTNYFAVSASLFCKVNVVGVVGNDYQVSDLNFLKNRNNIDLSGLKKNEHEKTFRWSGCYEKSMNEAITLETQLNALAHFNPELPSPYRHVPYVFLANIDPELQLQVLHQVNRPRVVGADTMNYWIDSRLDQLKELLKKIDLLMINEGELQKLTLDWNAISAVKTASKMGPKAIVVKRGEYGFLLYMDEQYFILPAFPVYKVVDPTGAGDTFAGGVFGYLANANQDLTLENLKWACVYGCLMASFTVQDFGLNKLRQITLDEVERRRIDYLKLIHLNQPLTLT
ncbi:MAG: sugar kinase [Bdellovibrionales bacterium]|nr:sugar kinase [Bdellovibrionales bacterium]